MDLLRSRESVWQESLSQRPLLTAACTQCKPAGELFLAARQLGCCSLPDCCCRRLAPALQCLRARCALAAPAARAAAQAYSESWTWW